MANERKVPLIAIARPELDLSDAGSIDRIVNAYLPRAIVNAAAYTFVDKAELEPDLAFKINRDGAAHLARVAARLRIPFIHVSTDYVFDGSKPTPYQEDDRPSPLGVYGRSKRDGEIAVLDSYPAAVILRTSWVYSPYGHNFVKTMLRLAETRDHIQVVDDQYGAPTSARDLAQAILEIVEQIEGRPDEEFRWYLSPHRCRKDNMVWLCSGNICGMGQPGTADSNSRSDHNGGLSDTGSSTRQFSTGLQQSRARLWHPLAALAAGA